MIIVVTGSRQWRDMETIATAFDTVYNDHPELLYDEYEVRQGCASGADAMARAYAEHMGHRIEDYWPAYMDFDFATANKERNIDMLEGYLDEPANIVLAFPTKGSRGTWHCVNEAKKRGIEVRIFNG